MPTQKLISKEKINSKYRRKYDKAKTAYQRVMDSEDIPQEKKMELAIRYAELNPFELKKQSKKNCEKSIITLR